MSAQVNVVSILFNGMKKKRKREQERREREEVEMYRSRNDARKFYQKVKRLTEGHRPERLPAKMSMVTW